MHSSPFSSGWKQLRPAHPKPFSGGSLSAPFQSRFGAIAFISLRRKQQRQGRQPLGCMQLEAVYPAPPLSSRQKTFHVAVLLYYPKVALYFPKLAAIYLGASFVMLSRQPRYAVAPLSAGGEQFMPAHPLRRRLSAKPRPAQLSMSEAGGNSYRRSFCYAGGSLSAPL